jgi:hypothetical protein
MNTFERFRERFFRLLEAPARVGSFAGTTIWKTVYGLNLPAFAYWLL